MIKFWYHWTKLEAQFLPGHLPQIFWANTWTFWWFGGRPLLVSSSIYCKSRCSCTFERRPQFSRYCYRGWILPLTHQARVVQCNLGIDLPFIGRGEFSDSNATSSALIEAMVIEIWDVEDFVELVISACIPEGRAYWREDSILVGKRRVKLFATNLAINPFYDSHQYN